MIPLDTPVGSQIKHMYQGQVVLGMFVGFTTRGSVTLIPENKIHGYRLFEYAGQPCYHFDNANCYVVTLVSPQTTQNKVLSRSLLLEKRFKEKQDAKKKKAVPLQNDESKRPTLRANHQLFDPRIWDNVQTTTFTVSVLPQARSFTSTQLGQLNGATWPFTG